MNGNILILVVGLVIKMKCPKCKSLDVVEYESKVACGYWCDKCDYEWLKKASLRLNKEGVLG